MLAPTAVALFERLKERARSQRKRIVFPEGNDPRVIAAADQLASERLVDPVRLTEPVLDPRLAELLYARRRAKGMTAVESEEIAARPLYRAALMVAAGQAEGCVGGAVNTTAETVRAALWSIGLADGVRLLSSSFLMALPQAGYGNEGLLLFADCAIVVAPDAERLADIAVSSARTARTLLQTEPVVALLSFSTHGSAEDPRVDTVRNALQIARARDPHLHIDGELQADAALVPDIARSKARGLHVAGHANTLIFPNLDAANIGYKLVQRLAGASALGPILQGLAKPMNDLSRGCSWHDVYHMAILTACQGDN